MTDIVVVEPLAGRARGLCVLFHHPRFDPAAPNAFPQG
jgi:hypothetical protein